MVAGVINLHSADRNSQEIRIVQLAKSFACLRKAPGVAPWDANIVDDRAATDIPSHGEKCSAQFILAVRNPDHEWQSGKFDLMEALRIWDDPSRQAFLAWVAKLWWA